MHISGTCFILDERGSGEGGLKKRGRLDKNRWVEKKRGVKVRVD